MAGDTAAALSPLDHALNAMLLWRHVALIRGDQVGLLAFPDRRARSFALGADPGGSSDLSHSVAQHLSRDRSNRGMIGPSSS